MPGLRGHHLVCLHFFDGSGCDEDFIKNLKYVIGRTGYEAVTVISGADEVCSHCVHLKNGACVHSENADKEIREMDDKACSLLRLLPAGSVRWDDLLHQVREIFPEWYNLYCAECDWRITCARNVFFRELSQKMKPRT